MPFINVKVNVEITPEKEEKIKSEFGRAIALIPGKSEKSLMIAFEDNCRMYFRGSSDDPIAFVEIKLFGSTTKEAYSAVTLAVTSALNRELSIDTSQIYVKYEEVTNWGCNGLNF